MAKLTEKQQKVLQYTLKYGRIHIHDAIMSVGRGSNLPGTINALVKRGYLKEDYPSLYYLLTDEGYAIAQPADAPTVNAGYTEHVGDDGSRILIALCPACKEELNDDWMCPNGHSVALSDLPQAVQDYVNAPTVNAEPWTPAVGMQVREKGTDRVGEVVEVYPGNQYPFRVEFPNDGDPVLMLADELEPAASADAVNAADVGEVADEMERFFTMSDAQKFSELINQADVIRKNDAQIAALTRDLADAVAERDALREALRPFAETWMGMDAHDRADNTYMYTTYAPQITEDEGDPLVGFTVADVRRAAKLLDIYAEDELIKRVAQQIAEDEDTDAAMVAALRSRDNGNRTPADNVLAMFADGEDGTIA